MKKNFKKVLSLALAFAMSFAAFAPTMVKAAETDYAKVDFMKVTNQFGDTQDIENADLTLEVLIQKEVPQGEDKKFKYYTNSEQDEVSFVEGKLVLNAAPNQGEDFKRYTLKDSGNANELKLPVGIYSIEVTGGNGAFKLAGQGSNVVTKIEVVQEADSNGQNKTKAKMKAGVDHIKLFQETEVQDTKLLKLVLLETVNNKKGAPIVNALVKIKVGNDWNYVFSNEKGEVQLVWKAPGTPTEAEIVSAPGYLFRTTTANYELYAKPDKSEKIVLNNQDGATNNGTYGVNKDGAFKDLNDNLTKEVYLEKDPRVITKFGKINITTVARDLEAVQKPVQGVEYTLFKGSEVITKGETNQYGKVTLKNIPVPKESEFKQPFTVAETLTKEYTLKQTKVPAGYVQDKLAYTVKFNVERTAEDTYDVSFFCV